jgi:DNA mismatch endonuclease (patch repair protein)
MVKYQSMGGYRPTRPIRIESDAVTDARFRAFAHPRGLRYRRAVSEMPGTPHLVVPRYRTVIFCCGCIASMHSETCPSWTRNLTGWRVDVQEPYFFAAARAGRQDLEVVTGVLERRGWRVLVLWDCQAEDEGELKRILSLATGPHGEEP